MLTLTLMAALAAHPKTPLSAAEPIAYEKPAVAASAKAEPVEAAPAPTAAEQTAKSKQAADDVVSAAFAPKGDKAVAPPSSSPSLAGLVMPALAIAALGAAAYLTKRRKHSLPTMVKVLETVQVGPKRSLVVAQMFGETYLIGSSEGGLSLLAARPTSPEILQAQAQAQAATFQQALMPADPNADVTPRGARAEPNQSAGIASAFERVMSEAGEDEELRAKLAAGMKVMVR